MSEYYFSIATNETFSIAENETLPTHDAIESSAVEPESLIRSHSIHRTKHTSVEILEYDPGEFESHLDADWTAWVLSGSARLELSDGREIELHPGKAFFLPRGLSAHWIVERCLKTAAVVNF